jgi:hypothetical protein
MKYTLSSLLFIALVAGCSKGKLETKPSLRVVGTSDKEIQFNGTFQVRLEFLDKEGDAGDSLIVRRTRINRRPGCDPQGSGICTLRDTVKYKIPEFPVNPKGEFEITFTYNQLTSAFTPPISLLDPSQKEPDTLVYRFVVRDKAGNKSDTAILENVVVRR